MSSLANEVKNEDPKAMLDFRRAQNVQWTTSRLGDWTPEPALSPAMKEQQFLAKKRGNRFEGSVASMDDAQLYENAWRGRARRIYDAKLLSNFAEYLRSQHPQAGVFLRMMDIAKEERAFRSLQKDYLSMLHYRQVAAKAVLRYYTDTAPHEECGLLEWGHAQRILGQVPKISVLHRKLLDALEDCGSLDTVAFLESMQQILKSYFHFNPTLRAEQKMQEMIEKHRKKQDYKDADFDEEALLEMLETASAEFTASIYRQDAPKHEEGSLPNLRSKTKSEKDTRAFLESYYGRSILSADEEERLRARVAKGVHKNQNILVTDGVREAQLSAYRTRMLEEAYEANAQYIHEHQQAIHRAIYRLADRLKSTMQEESAEGIYTPDGQVVASRAWRVTHLYDGKIFTRHSLEEPVRLQVDLLLDASASQQDRAPLVAAQAYILALALRRVGIRYRTLSFQSQQGTTILKRFHDYGQQNKAEDVLHYYPDAANRDGLALRLVRETMDRSRSNLRSVLIVLSDGKPFDERIGINSHRFTQEAPYEKDRAVEDTAREIRALRREGVAVLGVFTGLEEDLSAARRIYGQQFAYVKQVERFADTVALFLQEQLLS